MPWYTLLSQSSARETALLNAYLRTCRKSPQTGVLAVGVDMVLMNNHLRRSLAAQDQTALLEQADAVAINHDALVIEVLQKMVKQRRESIALYEQGGRQELADAEAGELAVIEAFLPGQMSEAETTAAIQAIKAELGATSVKDMGKVMAELKARHGTVLDMSKASGLVKAALA